MVNLSFLEPILGETSLSQLTSINPIFISIGIILASIVVATIALYIVKGLKKAIAAKTSIEFDDVLLDSAGQPVFRLIILAGVYLSVLSLELGDSLSNIILKILLTLMYLIIIGFAAKVFDIFISHGLKDFANKTGSKMDHDITPIFKKTISIVIWGFGIILILGAWGVDVGPFLAGLGIAGIAISFALQSTLSNVFAGISLILDKTFKVGDRIQLDTGESGIIHDITLRSTRVLTVDNEIIIVPNDVMAKARIKNFTHPDHKLRVVVDFSVEYGSEPKEVIALITKAIETRLEGILKEPKSDVIFTKMGDFSLNFSARFWIPHHKFAFDKKIEATNLIYSELAKAKIGIPFPTQTLYIKK